MMKKYLITAAVLLASLVALPSSVAAVDPLGGACRGKARNSAICRDNRTVQTTETNPLIGSGGVLTAVINILSIVIGIVALIVIVLAGLKFITSGSNAQEAANAQERVIYASVALLIAASAQVIVRFVLERIL